MFGTNQAGTNPQTTAAPMQFGSSTPANSGIFGATNNNMNTNSQHTNQKSTMINTQTTPMQGSTGFGSANKPSGAMFGS
jgi:hypothetical protein